MKQLVFMLGVVMGSPLLFAQSKSEPDSGVVPVQAIITVEARHDHDKNVPVINREDVMAYERNERLRVTDVVPLSGENARLELFLLLDDSSDTSLSSQLDDLRHFIGAQPPTTSVAVGYMHNGTVDTVQNFTSDHALAAHRLRLPMPVGGAMASPWLSLSDLIRRWPATSARREIVMITSGLDPLGGMGSVNPYLDTAIEQAQRNEVIVYAIYTPTAGHAGHSFFLLTWGQNHLAQLAEETGGEAYMLGFGPPVSFAPWLDEISGHVQHQYRVTFPMDAGQKGGLRAVRFATEVPNAELTAASRVYVKAPQNEQRR